MFKHVVWIGVVGAIALAADAPRVEPNAGNWKTWIIPSGKALRVAPPPDAASTKSELEWLRKETLTAGATAQAAFQIKYWDAGAPAYRWMDLIESRIAANETITAHPHRVLAYLAMAMYDATIAAWESKYAYNRPRPSQLDPSIKTAVAVPDSPSYPSEHAATAAAAAGVLGYFLPNEADSLQRLAEEDARSRIYAGVQYPSDYTAGFELGRQVAAKVIERIANDGYTLTWTGAVPTGPCMWTGTNPGGVTATSWKTLLLSSPSEFRPAAPPDCHSPEMAAQVATVKEFQRTFIASQRAFYWQSAEGRETWPYIFAEKWMFEDRMDRNPPRVARAYALLTAAQYDAYIASQDGKFAYWYLRPHQLDPSITPLFAVPNFPSYPSNHAVFSAARAEVLAYLFPARAELARATAKEASESRIWAGIHYPIDAEAGMQVGRSVAQKFIDWARSDGSE
ncbi:MAG TPA: phosphatase PAP2 family protein [Bryobacteraceae bacterium]|nr:phosphatase PAP2 family protein [Bryobacteraceae bacterium]